MILITLRSRFSSTSPFDSTFTQFNSFITWVLQNRRIHGPNVGPVSVLLFELDVVDPVGLVVIVKVSTGMHEACITAASGHAIVDINIEDARHGERQNASGRNSVDLKNFRGTKGPHTGVFDNLGKSSSK